MYQERLQMYQGRRQPCTFQCLQVYKYEIRYFFLWISTRLPYFQGWFILLLLNPKSHRMSLCVYSKWRWTKLSQTWIKCLRIELCLLCQSNLSIFKTRNSCPRTLLRLWIACKSSLSRCCWLLMTRWFPEYWGTCLFRRFQTLSSLHICRRNLVHSLRFSSTIYFFTSVF